MAKSHIAQVADNAFDRFQATQHVNSKLASQMDKIVGALQVGSKASPTDEQIQAKAEKRIASLKELSDRLQILIDECKEQFKLKRSKQLKALDAAADTLRFILEEKRPQGTTSILRKCWNEIVSTKESVYLEQVDLSQVSFPLPALESAVALIAELQHKTQQSIDRKEAADPSEISTASEEVLKENAGFQLKQPKKGSFVVTRAPVIPLTPVSAERLKSVGFKADNAGGYPIIHDQIVIGISRDMLQPTKHKKSGKISNKRTPLEVAEEIRRQVQKKLHVPIKFVVERAGTGRNIQGTWFWVMPDSELDKLAKVSPGKVVKIPSWGFTI